jgi:type IV secretion system protein VirB10
VSPWEVKAGTVIPAALLTAINSDLPGEMIAQVTEPVYDHVTGRTLLIPQGSRLIGQYDSQVAYGQERALIAWNRIVMPNGRSINIGSMEGADLSGASGLNDRVDSHFWQLARGIMLSTVFSVGAASAQDASARSSGDFVINSAGSGVSTEAEQVGSQITARDLGRQPRAGGQGHDPRALSVRMDPCAPSAASRLAASFHPSARRLGADRVDPRQRVTFRQAPRSARVCAAPSRGGP